MRIVLLHAFPFDERMWEAQLPALAEHELLTPHLYGLGETMDDWARSVARLEPEAVVGASMGGYCGQRLLAQASLRAAVFVGARAGADPPDRREVRDETIRLVREEGVEALWEKQRPALFPEDADEAVLARARELVLQQDPEELATGVAAMRDRPDSTALVGETEAKVLVARGEHDPFLSADEAEALVASARSARLHTFVGCGHLPSLERSDEVNQVLTEFLAGV